MRKLQFTEQFGLDLGFQAFIGDNAEPTADKLVDGSFSFDNLWTVFGGLRFNFNNNITFKRIGIGSG